MGSLTRDIMYHIIAHHGSIAASNIVMRKKPLQEPLDMSQPIYFFFKLIDDRVRYANEANTPFMLAQVLKMAHHVFSYYGINVMGMQRYSYRTSGVPK